MLSISSFTGNPCSYPVWHAVSLWFPVVEIEDHDGGDHAAGHHEHDAVEVGSYKIIIIEIEVWNMEQS